MLRRVVLALSNIPREVRQDELTDIKLQTVTTGQFRPFLGSSKCAKYQSMFTVLCYRRYVEDVHGREETARNR